MQRIYAEPIKEELIGAAHPRDQGAGRRGGGVAHAPARPQVLRDRARGGARRARDPGHRRVRGARVGEHRAAQPQGVHPRGAGAGDRRRLRLLRHRAAPDAHRRRGRARGRRTRRGVHHARRARDRRAAGHRDRRRRGRPLSAHARDGRVREGDRRRRDAERRRRLQGVRLRRRRGHDRLAAGPRLRGARPRLPLGHGHLPPVAPARRAGEDHPERLARADPARPGARERRHLQPDGEPPHLDGHLRLRGHRGVPQGRGDGGAGAPVGGQAAPAGAGHRHGSHAPRRCRTPSRTACPRPSPTPPSSGSEHAGGHPSGGRRAARRPRPTRSWCWTSVASTRS